MNPLLHISFTEREFALLKDILEREGYRSMSEVVRIAIREKYERMPKGKKTAQQDDRTPQEICFDLGGEVFEENGVEYCRIQEGAVTTDKPLSTLGV